MTSTTVPSDVAARFEGRWAWAEIDLRAVDHNTRVLRATVEPAGVWAVVKANGYGHGAVAVGRQALASGAAGLCVALTAEGIALREAGIDAPILVLSEQPLADVGALVAHRLTPTIYSAAAADALASVATGTLGVHAKIDTGMQRVGVAPRDAGALVEHIATRAPRLRLDAVFTHLACADAPADPANVEQLAVLDRALADLAAAGRLPAVVHAANSAGALALPASRRSFVRAGIAVYGISPGAGVDALTSDLQPVMTLKARVSYVKRVEAGSHVSYGWRHRFERATTVATVPIGYADGVPRRLGTLADRPGADVLIGGQRCPIVGVVTMDQLMVDVGGLSDPRGPGVAVGDEVVLIGRQGDHRIRAEHWADRLGTIGYEIVCGISGRIPRTLLPC